MLGVRPVDFSRRPSPDNPETRATWWNSTATIPAIQGVGRHLSKESQ